MYLNLNNENQDFNNIIVCLTIAMSKCDLNIEENTAVLIFQVLVARQVRQRNQPGVSGEVRYGNVITGRLADRVEL